MARRQQDDEEQPVVVSLAAVIALDHSDGVDGASESWCALETLYDRYAGVVYSLAVRIVGDKALAEEILNEVFFRASRRGSGLVTDRRAALSWLVEVTRAVAIDAKTALPDSPPAVSDTAPAPWIRSTHRAVSAALDRLLPEQRQAIDLAFFAGMTTREIAETLGVPAATVNQWLRDATRVLGAATTRVRHADRPATNRNDT